MLEEVEFSKEKEKKEKKEEEKKEETEEMEEKESPLQLSHLPAAVLRSRIQNSDSVCYPCSSFIPPQCISL